MNRRISRPVRVALLALLLVAFFVASAAAEALLKATFLDAGQGDAVLLRFPNGRVVLIDAGDDRGAPAQRVILPYLRANGIAAIDTLLLTHAHRDHLGGMAEIIRNFPVREFIDAEPGNTLMYNDLLRLLQEKKIPVRKLWQGDRPAWDPACDVQVLHPPRKWTTKPAEAVPQSVNLNNYSIVLRVRYGGTAMLLAGDAEKEAELEMISHYAGENDFRADLYKASHHGSKTSSSLDLLKRMKPAAPATMTAVICVGAGNSFGHPHAQTLANLEKYAAQTLRTDRHGTIESWSDGRTFRHAHKDTPNAVVDPPRIVYLSHDAATVRWSTARPSSSMLAVAGHPVLSREEQVTEHYMTATRLAGAASFSFTVRSATGAGDAVQASGGFSTPAAPQPAASLTMTQPDPTGAVVGEPTVIQVQADGGDTLRFYERAVSPAHVFAVRNPVKSGPLAVDWTPHTESAGELFAELLRDGVPVAVRRVTTRLTRRIVLLDAAHDNFGKDDLESLRRSLGFAGFDARLNVYPLNEASLAHAAAVVIPEIGKAASLADGEIAALRRFTERGGGLLLTSRADYRGASNPAGMNAILQAIGADLRFNGDQVLDPVACSPAGSDWSLLPIDFDRRIVSAEVKGILAASACSILNGRLKPAGTSDRLLRLARTSPQARSVDADGAGDAVAWPAGPIVVDAGDVLPSGARVAVFGATHILSPVYNWSSLHQTEAMNRDILRWLTRPRKPKAVELAERLAAEPVDLHAPAETAEGLATRRGDTRDRLLAAFEEGNDPAGALSLAVRTLESLPTDSRGAALSALKPAVDRVRHEALSDPDLLARMKRDLDAYDRLLRD